MFRCQVTGKLSRRGDPRIGELVHIHELKVDDGIHDSEKLHKIVVETRQVEYKHWDREAEEEWFSHGTEIVREINATDEGLRIWESMTPEQQAAFVKGLK
jgi:hypothetical protein